MVSEPGAARVDDDEGEARVGHAGRWALAAVGAAVVALAAVLVIGLLSPEVEGVVSPDVAPPPGGHTASVTVRVTNSARVAVRVVGVGTPANGLRFEDVALVNRGSAVEGDPFADGRFITVGPGGEVRLRVRYVLDDCAALPPGDAAGVPVRVKSPLGVERTVTFALDGGTWADDVFAGACPPN
jgi:hypothetical protein